MSNVKHVRSMKRVAVNYRNNVLFIYINNDRTLHHVALPGDLLDVTDKLSGFDKTLLTKRALLILDRET